nr:MAG TPA: hypothetical protein [Caudoviricetes sp.]
MSIFTHLLPFSVTAPFFTDFRLDGYLKHSVVK